MHKYMTTYCEKCNKFSHCNNNDLICISKYKAKEQECEQEKALKETYLTCYKAKHEDIDGELFKLKQTLTEIKNIAEEDFNHTCWETYARQLKQILQKINEVNNDR